MEAASAFGHSRLRIGALLLRSGLLDAEQLAEALDEKEESGERLGEIVVRHGWVTEEAFARTLADQLGLEFVDLELRESRAELLLSGKLARYFRCVPVRLPDEQTVVVATADPTSSRLADLASAIGLEIRLAVATESDVARAIDQLDPDGVESPTVAAPEVEVGVEAEASETTSVPGAEPPVEALEVEPEPFADVDSQAEDETEPVAAEPEPHSQSEPVEAEPEPDNEPEHEPLAGNEPEPPETEPDNEPEHEPLAGNEPEPPETEPDNEPEHEPLAGNEPEPPETEPDNEPEHEPLAENEPEPPETEPDNEPEHEPLAGNEPEPPETEPDNAPHAEAEPLAGASIDEPEQISEPQPTGLLIHLGPVAERVELVDQPLELVGEALPRLKIVSPPPTDDGVSDANQSPFEPGSADASPLHEEAASASPDEASHPGEAPVTRFESRRPQLGALLLRNGLIRPDDLAEALLEREETGERLGVILRQRSLISAKDLARTLAEQHGLEFIDLAASPPNPAVATLLPERHARRYGAIPVRYSGPETLLVAVGDPTDVLTSDDLRLVLGKGVQFAVATKDDIAEVLARVHGDVDEPVDTDDDPGDAQIEVGLRPGQVDVLEAAQSGPAVDFVNEAIKRAIQQGASDIHFEAQEDRLVARIRVDGIMHELRAAAGDLKQAVAARLKIMGELDIAERRVPQDGRVTILFGGKPVDLRIAVLPTIHGEQIVIRILYRSSRPVGFVELGFAEDTAAAIRRAIQQPYGIVLSVGPTGSGKTTTLYAALGLLNDPERCLMTIEDPVEYQLEGLNQIQIHTKAGLTFAAGLRTILRSDPDVLLVGEIRDPETARIAVQAAMTGHLVLSTLHADNVGTAVSRLVDMGVERQLLASTVNCILAQRLARRLCPSCRKPYEASAEEVVAAGLDESSVPASGVLTLYEAMGCRQCHSGYKGRLGLFETLAATPKVRRLVETATAEEIYAEAVADGMRTLQADGVRLAIEGLTSLDEVRRVAGERRI